MAPLYLLRPIRSNGEHDDQAASTCCEDQLLVGNGACGAGCTVVKHIDEETSANLAWPVDSSTFIPKANKFRVTRAHLNPLGVASFPLYVESKSARENVSKGVYY